MRCIVCGNPASLHNRVSFQARLYTKKGAVESIVVREPGVLCAHHAEVVAKQLRAVLGKKNLEQL